MSRGWAVLLCMVLMGCSGAKLSVREALEQPRRCVYVSHRDEASGANQEAIESPRVAVRAVSMAAPTDAAARMGQLDPRSTSLLRLVPQGGSGVEVGAGVAAGEGVVLGGAVVAAVGGGLLVCLTARAVMSGGKTPVDIADEYYGTHFGDVKGWVQGRYPSQASPGVAPGSVPDENGKKRLGRIYVTYRKLNRTTQRSYAGRTSMVVELTQSLELQAITAVLLRDKNHHVDEGTEPQGAVFEPARVDRFDVGNAIVYDHRYDDAAYWRIRGREQQLIDFLGGAHSDTGAPYRTENVVRGVARDNPRGRQFHDAATQMWGLLHSYTGD